MVSSLRILLFSAFFFVTFFSVTLGRSDGYLGVFPAVVGGWLIALLLLRPGGLTKPEYGLVGVWLFMLAYALVVDAHFGAFEGHGPAPFSVRWLSIALLSLLPAVAIVYGFTQGSRVRLVWVVFLAFLVQLLFWFATFVDLGFKQWVYEIMGRGDSVNLRPHNLHSRGFGIAGDINYTAPFMMVLTAWMLFQGYGVRVLVTVTQVMNSNFSVLASLIGFVVGRGAVAGKVVAAFLVAVVFLVGGAAVFDRFFAEFIRGSGLRTFWALVDDHFVFRNEGVFQHVFGAGEYVFKGGSVVRSDIGWVILYNYGGGLYVLGVVLVLGLVSRLAFRRWRWRVLWFVVGVMLLSKGILLSPNAYWFMSFIFMLNHRVRQRGGAVAEKMDNGFGVRSV